MKRMNNKVSLERLCDLFNLPTLDSVYDDSLDWVSEVGWHAEKCALDNGATEAEAEAAREEAESEANTEAFDKWRAGVLAASERLFELHGLRLAPLKDGTFAVKPEKSWDDVLTQIRQTINGVGYFYFATNREFLRSGPYTPMQGALLHLHWMADYPEVYGEERARATYDRAWR